MDKRTYFLNNKSNRNIKITELNLTLVPGVSNLFEINSDLSYEQIDHSMRYGTLRAAMDNKLCLLVPDIAQKSYSEDVIIRKPSEIQVFQSRMKFANTKDNDTVIFDLEEEAGLFDDDVKPARQIEEEELKKAAENIQTIEATVKEANLQDKPIENRYTPIPIKNIETQQKIKNNLSMGYDTCNGINKNGKICMRRAKTGKKYCSLHKNQK